MIKHLIKLKDKIKMYSYFVSEDQLGDSNRIVKMIGLIFILLGGSIFVGIFNSSNKVIVTELGITAITLSGLFFILADFSEYIISRIKLKKAIDPLIINKKKRKYALLKILFLFLAVFTLLIGPYISLQVNLKFLSKLNNSLSVIAIGLTVFKIGLNDSAKRIDLALQLMEEVNEIYKEAKKPEIENKEDR